MNSRFILLVTFSTALLTVSASSSIAATGTLTPAAPTCTIAVGASSCNVALTWTTTNPVGTSAVTSNWPSANTTVATGNSGSTSAVVPYNSRSFYLYNNAQLLATSNASASCASGTTWNGSVCHAPTSGTLSPAAPTCTIGAGANSCNVTLTWTTTNPVGTSAVTSNWPSANTTIATGNSGSVSASVPYNSRSFFLYNNAQLLDTSAAAASCASGTTWNGSVCQPPPPTGTLSPANPSCTIAAGASNCNVTLTWTTANPVGTSAVTSNWPSANTTIATGNSGSVSASVPYNSRSFFLYNNAQLLDTSNASATCVSGTTWNGNACMGTTSGTLTPSAPSCTIAAGANSCNVTLTWTTTNPVGTSAVTSNWPSANTTIATGNSGSTSASVPYNSRSFFLYNNTQQLATSNATASCASGTSWNGTACQTPMSGTLTPAAPSCTIAAGANSCNVTLAWTTTNPVGTSAVTSNWPSANTTVATGNSGSTAASVPYNSRSFFLYNNAQLLATSNATASCVSGTTWNGSVCQSATSGTLSPAAPACTIAAAASACDVTLTWTTTNPVGTAAVTSNWPSANTTIATGNSGSTSASVPYNSRAFFLYNNAQLLATSNATASCASGTTWNGSVCQSSSMSGTLTPGAPACTIAAGASSCNVTLTWTTTNPVGTSAVTSNWPSANTTVASGNNGTVTAPVPYNSRAFFLYNNAQLLATSNASASCASGTTWNGSLCQASSMSGTLTPAAPACTIAAGANSCNVTLTWTTTNPVSTSAVTSNWPSANTTVASGNNGTVAATVPYNSRSFFLYNNAQLLATSNATATCVSGTTWSGSSCQAAMSGTLTPAGPACTIAAGAGTCDVTLTWTTSNPVGVSAVTSTWPIANTQVASGNNGTTTAAVPHVGRAFFLYNNTVLLAQSAATASCAAGTTWDGSVCQASSMSGTLTPAAPACTIAAGASTCNVTLTWTTTNPVAVSAVTSNWPVANTPVAPGNNGTTTAAVPHIGRAFYLLNNTVLLAQSAATATCAAGTTWNGSVCQLPSIFGTLTPAAPVCTIAAGGSSCNVTLTWTTTNLVSTAALTSDWPSANTIVSSGNSGTTTAMVPHSGRSFFLYSSSILFPNPQLLATSVATASCTTGTTWNRSACQASLPLTLTRVSTSGPEIQANQTYTIVVHAAGNLDHVAVNWNDGSGTPVESKPVSGSQAAVTFTRSFNNGGTIVWTANAYDTAGAASNRVSGTFKVMANRIAGTAYRDRDAATTSVFLRRLGTSAGGVPLTIDPTVQTTWIVIHGRNSSSSDLDNSGQPNNIAILANAVAIARPKDQVLVLDWRDGADASWWLDFGSEEWIEFVGRWAADALSRYGFQGARLNLIGHSYGSYVAAEIGKGMPWDSSPEEKKVRSIVALDPAANVPENQLPPRGYDADRINFSDVSLRSWAFYSSLLGNTTTSTTASESFVVSYEPAVFTTPPRSHGLPVVLMASLIQAPVQSVPERFQLQEHFQLERLLKPWEGPWMHDRVNFVGARASGSYEALIQASGQDRPLAIDFDALTNVASAINGGTATASSSRIIGNQPDRAIDGNRVATGWMDNTAAWPDWLEVKFAGARTIVEVDVFSEQDGPVVRLPTPTMRFGASYSSIDAGGLTDFTVQYWSGTQWLDIPNASISANNLVWRQFMFPPVTTTSIRVLVAGAVGDHADVVEVEAYTSTTRAATPPQPPTNLRVTSVAGNAVTFSWTPPPVGPTATGFQIEGGAAPGEVLGVLPLGPAPAVTVALPTGSFYLRVRTLGGGAVSSESNEVLTYVGIPAPPSPPANLLGLAVGSNLHLTWTNTYAGGAPAAVNLDVVGAINGSLPLGVTDSFSFAGVPPGTYTFTVRAANAGGDSAASNPVTLTFPDACTGAPQPPRDYQAYQVGGVVFLSWTPAGNGPAPTGFVLNVTGSFVGQVPTPLRGLSGAVPPGTYHTNVVATNACGESAATITKVITIP